MLGNFTVVVDVPPMMNVSPVMADGNMSVPPAVTDDMASVFPVVMPGDLPMLMPVVFYRRFAVMRGNLFGGNRPDRRDHQQYREDNCQPRFHCISIQVMVVHQYYRRLWAILYKIL